MAKKKSTQDSVDLTLIPVEDAKHLGRDPHSKAILNTNKKEYMKAVQAKKDRKNKVDELQVLKDQVSELSELVKQLLGKVQ